MTKEEIRQNVFNSAVAKIATNNIVLLELPTGYGKSKLSIELANHIIIKENIENPKILLLVSKTIHKTTWKGEIAKWGGFKNNPTLYIECYESLKKCQENYDIIIADEIHHLGSEARLDSFHMMTINKQYKHCIGLSATIPRKLKIVLCNKYKTDIVVCSLASAIKDTILPSPTIVLHPMILDNTIYSESFELRPKATGRTYKVTYNNLRKYRFMKNAHIIVSCTKKQKSIEYNNTIEYLKDKFIKTKDERLKFSFLKKSGERLAYYSSLKVPTIKTMLQLLKDERCITFCKTIEQTKEICTAAIHSKEINADTIYNDFNAKKINHISTCNMLNENANLVDCKYAIFCNLSSSEVIYYQRLGRSLRHKTPVIIIPYFKETREEEIVKTILESFKDSEYKTVTNMVEMQECLNTLNK